MIDKSPFYRYGEVEEVTTKLDILEDIRNFLYALSGQEYMIEQLSKRTDLKGDELKETASEASSYVRVALEFLDQAREGPRDIAALPLFYVIHNLSKVYITLGPYRKELSANRFHGVSYDPTKDTPSTLLTEGLTLKEQGVLPLLYKTITGKGLKPCVMKMQDVYCYIKEISAEYSIVSGQDSKLLLCRAPIRTEGQSKLPLFILVDPNEAGKVTSVDELPTLVGFSSADNRTVYRGGHIPADTADLHGEIRKQLRPFLLYQVDPLHGSDGIVCDLPIGKGENYMPEELPIFLAFYHLSSVVRYKPILLTQLLQSRHSPLILGLQSHAILRFLMLTWSFIHRKNLVFKYQ